MSEERARRVAKVGEEDGRAARKMASRGGPSMRVSISIFFCFVALFFCAYTEHHKRLLAMHDSMVLGERLRRAGDKLRRAEADLEEAKEEARMALTDMDRRARHHNSVRDDLVEKTYKIEEEAEYYRTHNEVLMEQLKRIDANLTEIH